MSATSHYLDAKNEPRTDAETRGTASMMRLVCRFVGLSLIFAAFGMWLAPGADWSGDLLLMKVGASFFFSITGLTLFVASQGGAAEDES